MEPQIRFCTSADGTRIAYATMGEGPPLVVVYPWGRTTELTWERPDSRAALASLSQRRLYVTFDRRGVGASQREVDDFSLEAHVADVAAVADHLRLDRFDLWGQYEAAAVSVAYAAQNPQRLSRLVLWSPYSCGEEIIKPGAARGLVELIHGNWGLARRTLVDIVFPSGSADLRRWYSSGLRRSVSPEVAAKHVEFQSTVDVRPYLAQVKTPTLVLHRRGVRHAPISAGRAVAALIPDARFVALDGDMDHPYLGDTSYMDAMTQFLDEGRAAEPASPTAFRTILFTDVEGSTALTDRLGDARARELLREHERMIREALKSHGGSEVKALGDGFMTSFSSAVRALECAIAVQRAFAAHNESGEEPILVRVGLNAGEPIAEDDDLYGTAVNEAARITATAKGGEILASDVVRQLVKGKDFLFADRGEVSLKGFDKPVRLHEVKWEPGTR
jgi:class 3 adenylate cyclase